MVAAIITVGMCNNDSMEKTETESKPAVKYNEYVEPFDDRPHIDSTCREADRFFYSSYKLSRPLSSWEDSVLYIFNDKTDDSYGVCERNGQLYFRNYDTSGYMFEFKIPKGFNYCHDTGTDPTNSYEPFVNADKTIIITFSVVQNRFLSAYDPNCVEEDESSSGAYKGILCGYKEVGWKITYEKRNKKSYILCATSNKDPHFY